MKEAEVREVLGRVTAGELTLESDEVRDLLDASPELRERVDVAAAAGEALERAGAWHRSVQREAEEAPSSIQEPRIAELVQGYASDRQRRGRPGSAARRALVAAAAVLLVVLGWTLGQSGDSDEPGGLQSGEILGGEIVIVAPADGSEVPRYDRFEWRYDRTDDEFFAVDIWSVGEDGAPVEFVDKVENLTTPSWTPAEGRTDAWPDEILWQVRVTEYQTDVLPSDLAYVRRSSP